MIVMQSQFPFRTYSLSSGNVYVADQYGIIPNVATNADQVELIAAGVATLNPNPTDLLGRLIAANFNSTADQAVPMNNSIKYRVRRITVLNTSVPGMSTAVGGVYSAASKAVGQGILVAAGQAYTGLTNAKTALDLTLALPNLILDPATVLYLSLTTPQGAPATADVYVYGDAIPSP